MGIFDRIFGNGKSKKAQLSQKADELTRKAFSLVERGQYNDATQSLKKAITLDPLCCDAYNEIAFISTIKDDLDTAEEYAKKAVDCDPENPKFWNSLNSIQITRLKHLSTRKEIREKGAEIMPSIERNITYNPDYVAAYFTKARSLAIMGEPRNVWEAEINKAEEIYGRLNKTCSGQKTSPSQVHNILSRNRCKCEELNETWNMAS